MKKHYKIIFLFIIGFMLVVFYSKNRTDEIITISLEKRLLLLENEVKKVFHSYLDNKELPTINHEYALFSFSNKTHGHDPTDFFNLYYKIVETYNGSAQVGIFEYLGYDKKIRIFFGIDFPSDRLIIYESEDRIYKPFLSTREGTFNNRKLMQFFISQAWRTEQWELKGRSARTSLWKPVSPTTFDTYHISNQFRTLLDS